MRFIYDNRQNPLKLVGSHPGLLNIDPFYHIRLLGQYGPGQGLEEEMLQTL